MKIKVSFLECSTEKNQLLDTVCQLCYQFYQQKRNIYILCPTNDFCLDLDEYIISYQINHFFPYQIYGDGPIPPAPICLGIDTTTKLKFDILINLHSIIPDNFVKYRQVVELVSGTEQDRMLAREHFKHYKKLGLNPEFTSLTQTELT